MRLHEIVFIIIAHSHGVLCFSMCVVLSLCLTVKFIQYLILSDCFVHTVLLSL